jgi:hypothetical protein
MASGPGSALPRSVLLVAVFGPITSSTATRSRRRYREHLVEINSDNPAHPANAITGTKPGTPENGPTCK